MQAQVQVPARTSLRSGLTDDSVPPGVCNGRVATVHLGAAAALASALLLSIGAVALDLFSPFGWGEQGGPRNLDVVAEERAAAHGSCGRRW